MCMCVREKRWMGVCTVSSQAAGQNVTFFFFFQTAFSTFEMLPVQSKTFAVLK